MYRPDQFSGLVWQVKKGATVLAFSTGKMVITGPKSIVELNRIYDQFALAIRKTISATSMTLDTGKKNESLGTHRA